SLRPVPRAGHRFPVRGEAALSIAAPPPDAWGESRGGDVVQLAEPGEGVRAGESGAGPGDRLPFRVSQAEEVAPEQVLGQNLTLQRFEPIAELWHSRGKPWGSPVRHYGGLVCGRSQELGVQHRM